MELTMLGTGNAAVTECYNTCFALREKDEYFLVDAGGGNGILSRLKACGNRPQKHSHDFCHPQAHRPHFGGHMTYKNDLSGHEQGSLRRRA